jgi:hypothetical protein
VRPFALKDTAHLKSRNGYRNSTFSDDGGSGSLEGSLEGLARSSLGRGDLRESKADLLVGAGALSQSVLG